MSTENYVKCLQVRLKAKPILIGQISNCFVVTYYNLIRLRNEGKVDCISNFFSRYFPQYLGKKYGLKCRKSNDCFTGYMLQGATVWEKLFQWGVTGNISKRGNLGQNYNQEMRKNLTGSEETYRGLRVFVLGTVV